MSARQVHLSATTNGDALNDVLAGTCRYGWKLPYPEATVWIPRAPRKPSTTWAALTSSLAGDLVKPTTRNGHVYEAQGAGTSGTSQPTWPTTRNGTVTDAGVTWREAGADVVYDDVVRLVMGAGAHNVQRFYGYVRRLDFTLWPRKVGLVCYGRMILLAEYQNWENPTNGAGGLLLTDLWAGSATPTDEAIHQALLDKAGVPYTAANIGGTGAVWGSRDNTLRSAYLWQAGAQFNANRVAIFQAKGESALDYGHRFDAVSAVYTDATSPAGFYRLYETPEDPPDGLHRALIGGRPRGTVDLTFTEGNDADLLDGEGSREYPLANRVLVTGMDFGLGTGPVYAELQSSNDFMPSSEHHTYTMGSPMIEWALESDGGAGMNCERVANALMLDVNRETVSLRFTTGRDEPILPGMTVLVQATGGVPDRVGIGEALWVDENTTAVSEQAVFSQQPVCSGGGLPDEFTGAPPS